MRGRRRLTGRARDRSFRLSVVRSFYFNPSHPPDGTRLRRSVRYFHRVWPLDLCCSLALSSCPRGTQN